MLSPNSFDSSGPVPGAKDLVVTSEKRTISYLSVSARIRVIHAFSRMKREYNTILDDEDSVIFKLITVTRVKERIMGREKIGNGGRGGGGKIVILSTATSPKIPNHKTTPKKYGISKQHSKQAIRQGKLRKITKCLLTRFSYLQVDIHVQK